MAAVLLLHGCGPEKANDVVDADGDGYAADTDCDDGDPAVHPDAVEQCDGRDEDCDGATDNVIDPPVHCADADHDGYGDATAPITGCDAGGAVDDATDCNDQDPRVHPGGVEICDADDVDEDCDGLADDADEDAVGRTRWYRDDDGDGYGTEPLDACDAPEGWVTEGGDCDETNAAIHPGGSEVCDAADVDEDCNGLADDDDPGVDPSTRTASWADADNDGYGDAAVAVSRCDPDAGHVTNDDDCDDTAPPVHPGAAEVCNGIDDDCDTRVDDADTDVTNPTAWYTDGDGDGHGAGAPISRCVAPPGTVALDDDCDDHDASVRPDAGEICDDADVDENCDGFADDASATGQTTWFRDADGDDHGDATVTITACNAPSGYLADPSDCDDSDPSAWTDTVWAADLDADGYGNPADTLLQCGQPLGYVVDTTDCDDGDAAISPAAAERCDAADVDEDCDGLSDADDPSVTGQSTWHPDTDGDGYGDAATSSLACDAPSGALADGRDCNDRSAAVSPAATEVCDLGNIDEDCDGLADDNDTAAGRTTWYRDADADGFGDAAAPLTACDTPAGYVADGTDCADRSPGTHPGGIEICGPEDEDCDGLVDDADDSPGGTTAWYVDADNDGYGTGPAIDACAAPSGRVAADGDCNDADAAFSPGTAEVCGDGIDQDCDGVADSGCPPVGDYGATDADVVIAGEDRSEGFGTSVLGGLDFTGDGIDDLAIGAPLHTWASCEQCGAVSVVSGGLADGTYDITSLASLYVYGNSSTSVYVDLGLRLWRIGDMTSDGYDDFATTADTSISYSSTFVGGATGTMGATTALTGAGGCEQEAPAASGEGYSIPNLLCSKSDDASETGGYASIPRVGASPR